jgi:glutamate formiminotransferase/glutamate formiminotransferase/formiminotetrahydrofolate cyclodeaminase
MNDPVLLAVPNFSEGREEATITALAGVLGDARGRMPHERAPVRLLDLHSDRDHHRSVFTVAGSPQHLLDALLAAARVSCERIDLSARRQADTGQHPHVGALDVAPIVYLREQDRGAACAAALVLADRLAHELELPVFLYGELTADDGHPARTRAELRRGGLAALSARMADAGESLSPDFGPVVPHPTAGVTLVAARPPLVAFNLQLAAPATIETARAVAARVREGGEQGLPGLRAIGIELGDGTAQVSMNVERPLELPLTRVVEAVAALAPVASAELVGLAPAAALDGFPEDLPMPSFDPARHVIENALGA